MAMHFALHADTLSLNVSAEKDRSVHLAANQIHIVTATVVLLPIALAMWDYTIKYVL